MSVEGPNDPIKEPSESFGAEQVSQEEIAAFERKARARRLLLKKRVSCTGWSARFMPPTTRI